MIALSLFNRAPFFSSSRFQAIFVSMLHGAAEDVTFWHGAAEDKSYKQTITIWHGAAEDPSRGRNYRCLFCPQILPSRLECYLTDVCRFRVMSKIRILYLKFSLPPRLFRIPPLFFMTPRIAVAVFGGLILVFQRSPFLQFVIPYYPCFHAAWSGEHIKQTNTHVLAWRRRRPKSGKELSLTVLNPNLTFSIGALPRRCLQIHGRVQVPYTLS